MCGRGDQSLTWAEICELSGIMGATPISNLRPVYNIAPTTTVNIVREVNGERVCRACTLGVDPTFMEEASEGMDVLNVQRSC